MQLKRHSNIAYLLQNFDQFFLFLWLYFRYVIKNNDIGEAIIQLGRLEVVHVALCNGLGQKKLDCVGTNRSTRGFAFLRIGKGHFRKRSLDTELRYFLQSISSVVFAQRFFCEA